jgi:hypothetical protein
MCAPEDQELDQKARKAEFERNTRKHALDCITYMASIHLAYEDEPNHERITPNSFATLQCTRENTLRMNRTNLDPQADIVTVILDTVTDKRSLHLVKAGAPHQQVAYEEKVQLASARSARRLP